GGVTLGWGWWFGRWGCGAFDPFDPFDPFGRLRAGRPFDRLRMALRAGRRRSPYVLAGKPKFG
ncbi:MAG: hypothetical protein IIC28_08060, partial [Chloroflexi bacterium]|nr:hypothetical protein [Chloroflexota bacterium]